MKLQEYQKKPIVINAICFSASKVTDAYKFVPSDILLHNEYNNTYYIRTLEGDMVCSEGDYIIKGIQGEFYACKPDIFEATYVKANTNCDHCADMHRGDRIYLHSWDGKGTYITSHRVKFCYKCGRPLLSEEE